MAAKQSVDKARGGVRRDGVGLAGRSGRRSQAPFEARLGRPLRTPPPGPQERCSGHRGVSPSCSRSCLGSDADRRRHPCAPIWFCWPGHPARGRRALKAAVLERAAIGRGNPRSTGPGGSSLGRLCSAGQRR